MEFHGEENFSDIDLVHSNIKEIYFEGKNALVIKIDLPTDILKGKPNGVLTLIDYIGGNELITYIKKLQEIEIESIILTNYESNNNSLFEFTFQFSEDPLSEIKVVCKNYWWERVEK